MLTTVATFRDPWEAQLLRMRLDVEGLLAFVQYYHQISAKWSYAYALGCVHVQVSDVDADEAREIVRRLHAGEYRAELLEMFGDIDDLKCPKCGAQDFSRHATIPQIALSFSVLLLTGVPVPPANWSQRCRVCGARWVK
jgi:hypothetical protein